MANGRLRPVLTPIGKGREMRGKKMISFKEMGTQIIHN